ncbi:MAG: acyl carrier protein [Clostridiales bacterium]|jgi:acyl carrier protein|uniref:acyl carrier protein n=1 Tax=Chordicoccus furentiruminis TaxID=2709410 RepID=UPI0023A80D1C|nr:acyl carrier protein [Chordicoccus furentiruminis]MCI6173460.1 acyl carrier protein [Clostridiales bacterium]
MDELMKILEEARPDVDFHKEKKLIDDEILDSFDIISIVGDINDTFDVSISADELLPENFNSAEAIWDLIRKMKEQA